MTENDRRMTRTVVEAGSIDASTFSRPQHIEVGRPAPFLAALPSKPDNSENCLVPIFFF